MPFRLTAARPLVRHETDIRSDFMTGETGSYLQVTLHPAKMLTLASGVRTQSFALGGHLTTTPAPERAVQSW